MIRPQAAQDAFALRVMTPADYEEVALLIRRSTNDWYQAHGRDAIFRGEPDECRIFCAVYEQIDLGCGLVVEEAGTRRIVGSCFYHPRPTHVSVGIVNTASECFGRGIARQMLTEVIRRADADGKPCRLVSSALNLDSFSLYTRLGFVPRQAFQDMMLAIPADGPQFAMPPGVERVRPATVADTDALADVEFEIAGIRRAGDLRFFAENKQGIWNLLLIENADGKPTGFLASVNHPASCLIGPGCAGTEADGLALLWAQFNHLRGQTPVFLVPVDASQMVQACYGWGARNIELHFAQVRGRWQAPHGVIFPSFLPESG